MATYPNNAYTGRQVQNLPGTTYDPSKLTTVFAEDINNANEEIHALGADLIDNIKPTISQHGGQIGALDDQIDTVDNRITAEVEPRIDALEARTIYGTGFPNGVVTAPVGSIYIDTNITNGASSWIKKSGTGNTGWRVLEGDTGWRAVGDSVLNGWSSSGIGLKIRRLNGTVYLEAGSGGPNGVAKTNEIFYTTPAGFKPFTLPQYVVVAGASESGTTVMKRVLRNNSSFECSSSTSILFSAAYPTNDTWPTTLPGTAA